MPIELIQRPKDALTGTSDLLPLYTFDRFPVFMGVTDQPQGEDLYAPMSWHISASTGLIQLSPMLPLDVVYQLGHGSGSTGALWHEHHAAFAAFISQWTPTSVLEIGGCHGILAQKYASIQRISWTIVEPNPMPVGKIPATYIQRFFDEKFPFRDGYDVVVHSHVLEHIYDPNTFMSHLASYMSIGQKMIFSIPHMEVMLERFYTNCINFEHTILLTDKHVKYLLHKHGFRVVARELFREDHSIFYCVERCCDEMSPSCEEFDGLFERNSGMYKNYVSYHKGLVSKLNATLSSEDCPIYLFGAHVFSQYLIAFGLDQSLISAILDNDPKKQGKRLYGTSLQVMPPKVLSKHSRAGVILKAGVYNDEIRNDVIENINKSVFFID